MSIWSRFTLRKTAKKIEATEQPEPAAQSRAAEEVRGTGDRSAEKQRPRPKPKPEPVSEEEVQRLCRMLAAKYVRKDAKFHSVDDPSNSFNASDLKKIAVSRFKSEFSEIFLTDPLLKAVFRRAIEVHHDDPAQSIQVWNGKSVCRPDVASRLIPEEGAVTINVWKQPEYRRLGVEEADCGLLDDLLERMFTHEPDRRRFKDWLAWSLQNEGDKPGWAVLLYSRRKGTGKSSLSALCRKLFGEDNSFNQNGVEKLTGKFNMPLLNSKFVVSEEIKLPQGSKAANELKMLITEADATAEFKGKDVQRVRQCCCLMFTTNHMPYWIGDDRRYYVIDCDHEGHSAGPQAEEFGEFMEGWLREVEDPRNLAKIYNALMRHRVANDFDPHRINSARHANPLMLRLRGMDQDVLTDCVREYLDERDVRAIPQQELARIVQADFNANPNQVKHIMPELGWTHDKVKWGGKDYGRAIWVRPDHWLDRGEVRSSDGYREKISDEIEKADPETEFFSPRPKGTAEDQGQGGAIPRTGYARDGEEEAGPSGASAEDEAWAWADVLADCWVAESPEHIETDFPRRREEEGSEWDEDQD